MRLIDADKLIDFIDPGHLRQPDKLCFSEIDVANMINNTPTAYDVNEVLQQLDEEKKLSYADLDTCAELGPLQEPEESDYFVIGLKKAIKIIKCESESLPRGNMKDLISREQEACSTVEEEGELTAILKDIEDKIYYMQHPDEKVAVCAIQGFATDCSLAIAEEIVNIQKNSEIAENARTGYRFGLGVARSIVRKLEEKATKRRE